VDIILNGDIMITKLKKNEEKIILIIVVAVIMVFAAYKYMVPKPQSVRIINKEAAADVNENEAAKKNKEASKIYVYVAGEVNKPGVYMLKEGDRIVDAINMAGGFTAEADTMSVNLAEKLQDEKFITIAHKNVDNSSTGTVVKSVIINGKIDINNATAKEIDDFLPGIGEVYANNIVNYRIKNGRFKSVDEVSRVEGIGNGKRFERIKDLIYIN